MCRWRTPFALLRTKRIKKAFDMSDIGLLFFYLGVEVRQDTSGMALCQTHYAKRILELGGMTGCNPAHTPMEEKLKLSRESTARRLIQPIISG